MRRRLDCSYEWTSSYAVSCGEHNHRDKVLNQDPLLAENQPRHIYDAVKNQCITEDIQRRHRT